MTIYLSAGVSVPDVLFGVVSAVRGFMEGSGNLGQAKKGKELS